MKTFLHPPASRSSLCCPKSNLSLESRKPRVAVLTLRAVMILSPQGPVDGAFHLDLVGQTNKPYTVQVSTNLSTWTDWTNVTSPTSITPLADPVSGAPHRFYRASTH